MSPRHASTPQEATKRQMPAIEPRISAWVEANAGTGKTKVLTDRIVRLLLDDARPERIVCLTFTKAAAAEMRNRLSARLGRWAFADAATLAGELEEVLGHRPNEAATIVARRLFASVLDAPGGIAIQTIHAFCQSLLKRFPLEAGIAPNATVLDEGQSAGLLDRAMQEQLRALAEADADPALSAALATIGERISDSEYIALVKGLLQERGRLIQLAAAPDSIEAMSGTLCRYLGISEGIDCDALLSAACDDEGLDLDSMKRAAAELARGTKSDVDRALILALWLGGDRAHRIATIADYESAFFTAKGTVLKRLATAAVQKRMPDILDVLQKEAARLELLQRTLRSARLVEATMALLRLGLDILARYEALKSAAAALDYDDLILRTRGLLQDDATAWVLYKLDGGIDHVLIDEAQDTNPDQWEVARQLTREFFAGEGASDRPRTIFAVGDAKQSIFGFQRADPRKLAEMRESFRRLSESAQLGFRKVDLIDSFRSTEAVLAAVDLAFASAGASDGVAEVGEPIEHLAIRAGHIGAVELWPVVSDTTDEDESYDPDAPPREATTAEERLAQAIVEHCKTLIGHERNAQTGALLTAGDIMILVRRRNALVPALVRALKRAGIAVSGVDRMALLGELAIRDLLAVAQFVLLPQDDLNLACLLKSPLVGLDEDALLTLAHGRTGRLWRALQDRSEEPLFAPAHVRLAGWLARADFVPPFEFYAEILGPGRGRHDLLQRLGRESQDPIDEFLALALRYQAHEPPSLQGFVHWLQEGAGDIKRDLDQNRRPEVRILTVHASKGLQAPVVYLPDTVRVPNLARERILWPQDDKPPLWIPRSADIDEVAREARDKAQQRSLQEHRRLLYVAMTRAADRLYVCGATGSRKPDRESWYNLILGAFEASAQESVPELLRPQKFAFDSSGWIGEKDGWQGDGWRLEHGDRVGGSATAAEPVPEPPPLPHWALRAAAAEADPPHPLAPSRLEAAEAGHEAAASEPPVRSPLASDAPDRFKRGVLIHRLLQSLPDLDPGARRAAAARFLQLPGHALDTATVAAWIEETIGVLEHPDAHALFAAGSRAEVPITGVVERRGRHFVVSGQIDRLAVTSDEVLIVDFKTNRPPPRRPQDVATLYRRQMGLYRAILTQLYPARRIRCFLLWTDVPQVMELPDPLLDAALP